MRVILVLLVLGLPVLSPAQQIVIGEYQGYLGSGPNGITSGPDGALWFTESSYNSIGRLSVSGVLSSFAVYRPVGVTPINIASGSDGKLWFTESRAKVGKLTTGGVFNFYTVESGSAPVGITAGPDGQLWITDHGHNLIASISKVPLPLPVSIEMVPSL